MPHQVAVRGAQIAFDQTGGGPVDVLLVHGFQNAAATWQPFVERLDPDRFRVTRLDLVGCGSSSGADGWRRCTIDEYAEDVVALCEALSLERPVAVGHSLGGATVIEAALRYPRRFSRLVLVAPASARGFDYLAPGALEGLCHPTPEAQRQLTAAAFRYPPPSEDFERIMEIVAQATPEHIEGAARSMDAFQRLDDLHALHLPTLMVCGDRDRHVPLGSHLATQQAIPRSGLQVYTDVGHVPFVEIPDRFAADVTPFLAAQDPFAGRDVPAG